MESRMTLAQVDALLDELASTSAFSQLSQTPSDPRSQSQILNTFYRYSSLSAYAAAVLTQIILRDLRPLLCPVPRLPIRNPTAMLRLRSNAGPAPLEQLDAMHVWDPRMRELYLSGLGSVDLCADIVESLGGESGGPRSGKPEISGPAVGVNVPVSVRGSRQDAR
jgi:DNA ligase-4